MVSESMVRAELTGMLVAGHEALGQSLAWALQLLASHPEVQVRVRALCRYQQEYFFVQKHAFVCFLV